MKLNLKPEEIEILSDMKNHRVMEAILAYMDTVVKEYEANVLKLDMRTCQDRDFIIMKSKAEGAKALRAKFTDTILKMRADD